MHVIPEDGPQCYPFYKTCCSQGLRVLEIGAGNGLCSLTAASLGANATATEFNPLSLQLIAESAQLQKGVRSPFKSRLIALNYHIKLHSTRVLLLSVVAQGILGHDVL
jgi:predicted nicotinamide N-methyase